MQTGMTSQGEVITGLRFLRQRCVELSRIDLNKYFETKTS